MTKPQSWQTFQRSGCLLDFIPWLVSLKISRFFWHFFFTLSILLLCHGNPHFFFFNRIILNAKSSSHLRFPWITTLRHSSFVTPLDNVSYYDLRNFIVKFPRQALLLIVSLANVCWGNQCRSHCNPTLWYRFSSKPYIYCCYSSHFSLYKIFFN